MRRSAIRHLAISGESAIVVAAFFQTKTQIWSWATKQQLSEFETILDFGGRRLALTPDGSVCIAGSFHHGLAAYSVPEGRLLWHRKDIRKVQRITLNSSGRELYCGVEGPSVFILETDTGTSLGKVARASSIIASHVSFHRLIVRRGDSYLVEGDRELEIPAASFSLLDAAFSSEAVCISEPRTGIRCIDLASGNLVWHYKTLGANHIAFNSSDQRFYCVGGLDTKPHSSSLIRLANTFLECDRVAELNQSSTEAFTPSGAVLVTKEGEVYETSSGNLLAVLEFPQCDYPDSGPSE